MVARPRLIEQLHDGLAAGHKLTLISAPAGFGKTTLVSEWLAGKGGVTPGKGGVTPGKGGVTPGKGGVTPGKGGVTPGKGGVTPGKGGVTPPLQVAWLSLDKDDQDVPRFLTYVIAALQTIAPTVGETPLAALQSSQPPQFRLVIASCEDPPLPLARLPARGQLTELFLETPLFTGRAPLLPVRIPLSTFEGVSLASIAEVALVFDQTDRGTLFLADAELARSPIGSQKTLGDPPSAELIAAAEAGDVEAMRQLANLYRPTEALGVQFGNLEQAVYWYRQACAAGYANAQVDFYEFARAQADMDHAAYLEEAIACLEDAIRQGHRSAIIHGAFRAAFIEQDYATAFFLYALLEDTEPDIARQRGSFADQLTQAEIDEAEQAAAEWRASNPIKDYEDFFAAVDSPFRQPAPGP